MLGVVHDSRSWPSRLIARASSAVWTAWALRRCALVGRGTRARGRIWVHGGGRVILGRGVILDASVLPIELHAGPGAAIVVGDGVVISGGASIEALGAVTIGAHATLGRLCKIMDSHFHPLTGDRLASTGEGPDPVVVGEGVDVGPHAIVLAGAHLARGARVSAGSVVSRRRGERRSTATPRLAPAAPSGLLDDPA